MLKDGTTKEPAEDEALAVAVPLKQLTGEDQQVLARAASLRSNQIIEHVMEFARSNDMEFASEFDDDARDLMISTWTFADQLGSRAVTSFHLIAALIAKGKGLPLTKLTGVEEEWLLSGAVIRSALLKASSRSRVPFALTEASLDLARWVSEACKSAARSRAQPVSLQVEDFINVLTDPAASESIRLRLREILRESADLGRQPSEYVKTRSDIDSAHRTVRHFRKDTERGIEAIVTGLKGLSETLSRANGGSHDDAERHALVAALLDLKGKLDKSLATAPSLDLSPVNTAIAAQGDRITADIKRHLAPPSAGWLAASVLAVLALGVGAGLMMVP